MQVASRNFHGREGSVTPSFNWPLIIGISLAIVIIGIAAALRIRKGTVVEKPSSFV